jgi:exodeoxyribonuclease-3
VGPADFVGATHVTDAERQALQEIIDAGFVDLVRRRWPDETIFTYWDYRQLAFPKNLGMRIDLALATEDVAARTKAVWVDRAARKGTGTSDHAPVVVDLDTAPDGDIGPLVPPPSSRPARSGGNRGGPAAGTVRRRPT